MNWEAIGSVGEIVGAFAVVVSIIYLAGQVRNQTKEARLTATRDLARDYRELIRSIAKDPELYEIYQRAVHNYNDLQEPERMRIHLYVFSPVYGVLEQQHLHLIQGNIDPEFLESVRNRIAETARLPGIREWWERNRDIYGEDFRAYVDSTYKIYQRTNTQADAE